MRVHTQLCSVQATQAGCGLVVCSAGMLVLSVVISVLGPLLQQCAKAAVLPSASVQAYKSLTAFPGQVKICL